MDGIIDAVVTYPVWIVYGHFYVLMSLLSCVLVYLQGDRISVLWAMLFGPVPLIAFGTAVICTGTVIDINLAGLICLSVGLGFYAFSVPLRTISDPDRDSLLNGWLIRLEIGSLYVIVGWLAAVGEWVVENPVRFLPLLMPAALLLISPVWFKSRLTSKPERW